MRIARIPVTITLALVIATAIHGAASAATYTGLATSYASCDGSTSMTASGRTAQWGYVANNFLPFGTWIEMIRPKVVQGRTFYRVFDRGGGAFLIDIWTDDCGWMNSWGGRTVTFRTVPRSEMFRGKPVKGWRFRKTPKGAKLVWKP